MKSAHPNQGDGLLAAYAAAHYEVIGTAPPFVLRVGQRSAELAELHRANGVNCSAFITAWNPQSVLRSEASNCVAQKQLESELAAIGVALVAGVSADPSGRWPAEPSILVVGISQSQAARAGRRFGQRAIVWCGESAVPELIDLLAPGRKG